MYAFRQPLLNFLSLLLLSAALSTVAAHEFQEINQTLPEELQIELLSILTIVTDQHVTARPPENNTSLSFPDAVLLYAGVYEENGRQSLLNAIASSALKDAFEPAPYSAYIETLSGLLYDYTVSHSAEHDGDEHTYSPAVSQQLKELQEEVAQWLQ